MSNNVRVNFDRHRFELDTDSEIAFSHDRRPDDVLTVLCTAVPTQVDGQGVGSAAVRGILDIALALALKVNAPCPFANANFRRLSRIC
jgi:predicted GNAT family acetyltransferase